MFAATVPGNRYGSCGIHPISDRSTMRTAPDDGAQKPSSTSSTVDFPHPLGPASTGIVPGRAANDTPLGAAAARPGCRTVSSVTAIGAFRCGPVSEATADVGRGAASGVSMTARAWSIAASPSALAWNWAAA